MDLYENVYQLKTLNIVSLCVSSLNWNAREVLFLKNNNGTKNYDNNDNDKDNDDDNEDDYDDDSNDDNDNTKNNDDDDDDDDDDDKTILDKICKNLKSCLCLLQSWFSRW